jgi:tetratricopeptide (TPR) repeat protein
VLAAIVAAVLGIVGMRAAKREEAIAKEQQLQVLYATLPSVLAVEGSPDERILLPLQAEHRLGVELLDQLIALAPADLPARLFRACLHQDLGDVAAAAADFAALAAQSQSDYLRELARRYATAPAGSSGAKIMDLAGLPTPVSAEECYVAGFHELRRSDTKGFAERADALFMQAAAYPPAREGRLLSLAARSERQRGEEQVATLLQLHDETVALEQFYGRPTARTTAMRGVAWILRKNYLAAVPEFEQSLRLRPNRHGPLQNLGICWFNLGDLDRAHDYLQQALAVRPFAWNTRHTMALVARDRGQFSSAMQLAAGLAKTGTRGEAWKQPDLVAGILLAESQALRGTDAFASRQLAARAVAAYDEALGVRADAEGLQRRELAAALMLEQPSAHLLPFLQALLPQPDNPHQLANLAFLLPDAGLSSVETAWLAAVLRQLAASRAAGDTAFRQRMQQEIDKGVGPR